MTSRDPVITLSPRDYDPRRRACMRRRGKGCSMGFSNSGQNEQNSRGRKNRIPDTLFIHELRLIDAYWRAANYLSVEQIYLLANPLLEQPLTLVHIKPRLLGHWGTTPGLNFIHVHLNRVIRKHDLTPVLSWPKHQGLGSPALERIP
jgi:phosphoketolase